MSDNGRNDFKLGYEEITEAVRFLDGEIEDQDDGGVDKILADFNVDINAVMHVSTARGAMVAENLVDNRPRNAAQGIELLAGLGASWLDGFCAALRAVQSYQEQEVPEEDLT
jgi:hypothetical protein